MSAPPRLREDVAALTALVQRAAASTGVDQTFLEKDFWVTEVLRAVAPGVTVAYGDGAVHVPVVFKGGTSLSRVYELTYRFSEDVDLLVLFPEDIGANPRDRALKALAAATQQHLGLSDDQCQVETSTTGVKRNVHFTYPRSFPSPVVKEHVLLEMGGRGGPEPHGPREMVSMVARYARETWGQDGRTWAEFEPFTIDVLAPERTLLEKCALLHNLGARIQDSDDEKARQYMDVAGRHYYDIGQLLADAGLRAELTKLGATGVARLAADIDAASAAAGWRFATRPSLGYATSPAFDPSAKCREQAERSYTAAMAMVYRPAPSFDDVLARVHHHARLL